MGGVINFFFPNRKNYWTLTKINFTIVFLTIQSLGINFKISQNLLIWYLKKFPQKTSCNTNKSRKIKFFGEMNLTIKFFTPENVGINLNITKYISLLPPKKFMKKYIFVLKICSLTPNPGGFLVARPLWDVFSTSQGSHNQFLGVACQTPFFWAEDAQFGKVWSTFEKLPNSPRQFSKFP